MQLTYFLTAKHFAALLKKIIPVANNLDYTDLSLFQKTTSLKFHILKIPYPAFHKTFNQWSY